MVRAPLIVDIGNCVNDMRDRDGGQSPIKFDRGLGLERPIRTAIVQAATKWNHVALKQFGCGAGQTRTQMIPFRKEHLGRVSVWRRQLKDICERDIFVLG